ncbi:hypothetical protein [uncultured Acetobacteroides sp.]|uniref:hypothetical protein n=1 Tax=uncultured Acetobacteroides sp. TaxID=1760811 RepID=UPI0029F553D2|nr:hypothetical protein [uncultured Acetobacteroides sp.]
MRTTNGINNEEKWKEALEEWTPDVEVTGWEDVAGRIPSGRAFRVRQRVEGGAVRVARAVVRFVSLKMAVVAIVSAAISGYVTYRIVEKHTVERIVVKEYVMQPAAFQQAVPRANGLIGAERYDGADASPLHVAGYWQPGGAVSTAGGHRAGSANLLGIGREANSGSNRDLNGGRAGAAGCSTDAYSTGAAVAAGGATRSGGAARAEGEEDVALSPDGYPGALPTQASSAAASMNGESAAVSGATSASHKGGVSDARHSSRAYAKSQGLAGAPARASVSEMDEADAVSGREWIKKRRMAKARQGSAIKHRALASAPSVGDSDAASAVPSSPASGSSFAKRELPDAPIGRGGASLQKYHLNPSWSTSCFLSLEYPEYHVPFKRYLSYFWGVSLDAGTARSGSSFFVLAGANAFVGSMYKEKVGLMLSVGGRWLGDLPSMLLVDSNTGYELSGARSDSSKRSSSLQSYYQALLGLDGVVRLYSGAKTSFSTTLGARGCWTQLAKGDSTSKRFIPLSAVRFSASYLRRISVGQISLSPFAEYQLNGAGTISKSTILFGLNVGVIF